MREHCPNVVMGRESGGMMDTEWGNGRKRLMVSWVNRVVLRENYNCQGYLERTHCPNVVMGRESGGNDGYGVG